MSDVVGKLGRGHDTVACWGKLGVGALILEVRYWKGKGEGEVEGKGKTGKQKLK